MSQADEWEAAFPISIYTTAESVFQSFEQSFLALDNAKSSPIQVIFWKEPLSSVKTDLLLKRNGMRSNETERAGRTHTSHSRIRKKSCLAFHVGLVWDADEERRYMFTLWMHAMKPQENLTVDSNRWVYVDLRFGQIRRRIQLEIPR